MFYYNILLHFYLFVKAYIHYYVTKKVKFTVAHDKVFFVYIFYCI